jgi:putative tryptophan/tyrosine transport system substrate-binding protein
MNQFCFVTWQKEVVPKLSRVAVLGTSPQATRKCLNEVELAVEGLRVKPQYLEVLRPNDIETAFRAAEQSKGGRSPYAGAGPRCRCSQNRDHRTRGREPAPGHLQRLIICASRGLVPYAVNAIDLDRRAPTFVDKILKGAKPADLPVEQPPKFEFIINLKAAKQIGLTIPQTVLYRADKIIK